MQLPADPVFTRFNLVARVGAVAEGHEMLPQVIALVPAEIDPFAVMFVADSVPLEVSDEQLNAPPVIAFVPAAQVLVIERGFVLPE